MVQIISYLLVLQTSFLEFIMYIHKIYTRPHQGGKQIFKIKFQDFPGLFEPKTFIFQD